jgi:hypothetical protein
MWVGRVLLRMGFLWIAMLLGFLLQTLLEVLMVRR